MYTVLTTVKLKPGMTDDVLALFRETNPGLVEHEEDWVAAKFTANREKETMTVMAFWKNADSYKTFRESEHFKKVMGQFSQFFAGPPEVSINEILFEMKK